MPIAGGLDTCRKPIIFDCQDTVTSRCARPGQPAGRAQLRSASAVRWRGEVTFALEVCTTWRYAGGEQA